jgi:hypothetical protein
MNVLRVRGRILLASTVLALCAIAPRDTAAQLSGLYQTAPGAVGIYNFQYDNLHSVTLPLNITVSFSGGNPTTSLSATIVAPVIGALADGSALYPIGEMFPMRVTATSNNDQKFHGSLAINQYLFDWTFQPGSGNELLLNGQVYWAGGRYEVTTISAAHLAPSIAGDYNQNGTVDVADYLLWRRDEGTTSALPNDPLGGTIGQAHYDQWREHFGQSTSAGSAAAGAVPEPATLAMLIVGAIAIPKLIQRHARPDHTDRAA